VTGLPINRLPAPIGIGARIREISQVLPSKAGLSDEARPASGREAGRLHKIHPRPSEARQREWRGACAGMVGDTSSPAARFHVGLGLRPRDPGGTRGRAASATTGTRTHCKDDLYNYVSEANLSIPILAKRVRERELHRYAPWLVARATPIHCGAIRGRCKGRQRGSS